MKMKLCLPLLFADGQPTSLEKITEEQLVKFIPFMISCCPCLPTDRKPIWWPNNVPYRFPLRAMGRKPEIKVLREIVCRCYEFHDCEHALRFSARLSEMPFGNLFYSDEDGGFVSVYNKKGVLVVKFKKKVQTYDKVITSPHKSLLPRKPQLPDHNLMIEDIYLCNYCDEEFMSARDATAHESVCDGKADEEVKQPYNLDQGSCMRYFGLCPAAEAQTFSNHISRRGTSLKLTARSCTSIPISSPMGAKLAMNVPPLDEKDKRDCVSRIEKNCSHRTVFSDLTKTRRPRRTGDSFYSSSMRRTPSYVHYHTYCFNKAQRKERKLTLQTGLNKKSRQLLKSCRPVSVVVEALPILDPLALHAAASLKYMPTTSDCPREDVMEQNREDNFNREPSAGEKVGAPVIDLCSSSEGEDDNSEDNNNSADKMKVSITNLKCHSHENDMNSIRQQYSANVLPKSPFQRNNKLTQVQEVDGPQYGISARSSVSSLPLLMPAIAEEQAQVPVLSASQNWLSSSANLSCSCNNVVCVCVQNSSQQMVPLRPIRI